MTIRRATTDANILRCFDVMAELRTHIEQSDFLARIRLQEADGFKLAFVEDDGAIVAVAGYRLSTNLFLGKHLYVDDLVTATAARSRGYGARLLGWLREQAVQAGCDYLHLDSGTQRGEAHKFYFREGMTISAYHFVEKL